MPEICDAKILRLLSKFWDDNNGEKTGIDNRPYFRMEVFELIYISLNMNWNVSTNVNLKMQLKRTMKRSAYKTVALNYKLSSLHDHQWTGLRLFNTWTG